MKNITWMVNRLRTMSFLEIVWRVQQWILHKKEKYSYSRKHIPITQCSLSKNIARLRFDPNRLFVNWNNSEFSVFESLALLGPYSYENFKTKWNAGYQTTNTWCETSFSYDISYGQREDIGDVRTNWELSRHYQFVNLAKSYYITLDDKYLDELYDLFDNWNIHNLFLHGIEWVSNMELAIRVNSWLFACGFLDKAFSKTGKTKANCIISDMSTGVRIMVGHIIKHRSRYSSANNHLIIEMYAVCLAGIIYSYDLWIMKALNILTEELLKQNNSDGVNKEMSLHYQSFIMEAYGLLILALTHNNIEVPNIWFSYLEKMSEFLADSCGDFGETVVFGDNDEGKLLDLCGGKIEYYRYVLDLMGCVLSRRFTNFENLHENIKWLMSKERIHEYLSKELYVSGRLRSYRLGGYSFIRSHDRRILIGIDHAPLGFGKLAAHGHADSLSFQMFIEGISVFVDPGTYNYHVPKYARDLFRSTQNHNTVTINGKNQSEILGPFMWGKRADSRLLNILKEKNKIVVHAQANYDGTIHSRKFSFLNRNIEGIEFLIEDDLTFNGEAKVEVNFLIHPTVKSVDSNGGLVIFNLGKFVITLSVDVSSNIEKKIYQYSSEYGITEKGIKISISQIAKERVKFKTKITIETRRNEYSIY